MIWIFLIVCCHAILCTQYSINRRIVFRSNVILSIEISFPLLLLFFAYWTGRSRSGKHPIIAPCCHEIASSSANLPMSLIITCYIHLVEDCTDTWRVVRHIACHCWHAYSIDSASLRIERENANKNRRRKLAYLNMSEDILLHGCILFFFYFRYRMMFIELSLRMTFVFFWIKRILPNRDVVACVLGFLFLFSSIRTSISFSFFSDRYCSRLSLCLVLI